MSRHCRRHVLADLRTPTTCMTNAADCGGMLRVVALENAAFTIIPALRSLNGIRLLLSSIITVLPLTFSRMV